MEELSKFITLILSAVITAVVPVLTYLLWQWVKTKLDAAWATLSEDQQYVFRRMVEVVVQAAEQSGLVGLIEDTAVAKKAWAVQTLQTIVDQNGWSVPVAQIEAEIEAAILNGIHKKEPPRTPSPAVTTTTTTTTAGVSVPAADEPPKPAEVVVVTPPAA